MERVMMMTNRKFIIDSSTITRFGVWKRRSSWTRVEKICSQETNHSYSPMSPFLRLQEVQALQIKSSRSPDVPVHKKRNLIKIWKASSKSCKKKWQESRPKLMVCYQEVVFNYDPYS